MRGARKVAAHTARRDAIAIANFGVVAVTCEGEWSKRDFGTVLLKVLARERVWRMPHDHFWLRTRKKHGGDFVRRTRFAEQIALQIVTANGPQEIQLPCVFDAFRCDIKFQGPRQFDRNLDDRSAHRIGLKAHDERLVDLEPIKREFDETAQR